MEADRDTTGPVLLSAARRFALRGVLIDTNVYHRSSGTPIRSFGGPPCVDAVRGRGAAELRSPVQLDSRIAIEGCSFNGLGVRRGDDVVLLVGTANRAPDQFDARDPLDAGRRERKHLAFDRRIH